MADGILDFFSREAGQRRRRDLEDAITYYIPPELRGLLGLAAEANPIVGAERAGQDAQVLFAPDQALMDRLAAGGRMASNMAGIVAPAVVAGRAAIPAAQALQEGLLGFSQGAQDIGRGVVERLNQPGPVPTMYSNPLMRAPEAAPVRAPLNLEVTRRDASNIFGEGTERVRYTDPKSGGAIEVVARPDGSASVLELEVPESFRGQGIGQRLQERVMQDFPIMGGQVSSKAAATTAYQLGRRPPNQPNATLDEVFAMIDDMSSVNLVSPKMQARFGGTAAPADAAPEGRIMAAISAARPTGTARGLLAELGTNEYGGVPVPGANAVDPAIAQAEEVLGLIRAGRADEVTREMLDMGDDVLNARLNEHLWNNYDLPMDEASRMERARGFQGGLYSGTGDNFTAFSGQSWATDNPDLAYTYAPSVGGSVMPLMMRAKHGAPVVNAGGANWNALTPSMREGGPQAPYLRGILTDPEDLAKYGEDLLTTQNFADAAKEQGFSGVTFNDVVDVGGYLSKYFPEGPQRDAQRASIARAGQPSKVEMRLYPNQVRSRFARFDPRLRHLDNLNAALAAGAPLGLLAMQPDEEY